MTGRGETAPGAAINNKKPARDARETAEFRA